MATPDRFYDYLVASFKRLWEEGERFPRADVHRFSRSYFGLEPWCHEPTLVGSNVDSRRDHAGPVGDDDLVRSKGQRTQQRHPAVPKSRPSGTSRQTEEVAR